MDYVLITGSSGGIGYELARVFAKNDYGLILNSSNSKRLTDAKEKLQEAYHVPVFAYEQDLAKAGAAQELYRKIKEDHLSVHILVNNAGFGLIGEAHKLDASKEEEMLMLNIVNLVQMSKLCLSDMIKDGKGKVLNVASTGAFQPGPYTASYYASKTFVLNYTRALRCEVHGENIQISALCPGTTKTGFFARAGTTPTEGGMTAEKVAQIAFRGLMKNKEIIIPGIRNHLMQIFPAKIKMLVVAKVKKKHMNHNF